MVYAGRLLQGRKEMKGNESEGEDGDSCGSAERGEAGSGGD
jgi:hypothetical protein